MDMDWKQFFRYFRFFFLAILILAAVWGILTAVKGPKEGVVRTNAECTTRERVFDGADVLTDEQEDRLRALIAQKEEETGCDIVLVTLDESLEEYARKYEDSQGPLQPYQYTMVYADNFYDEHKFGFDRPCGDGVLLLDNWYREEDGKVYSWLSTCGRAESRFSASMIDDLLNEALENVAGDPYGAYRKYVELFAKAMNGENPAAGIPFWMPLLAALAGTAVFVVVNVNANRGSNTTGVTSYVPQNGTRLKRKEDIFMRKTVTRRRIQRDNGGSGGGGGGGHHVSSGGVSHGGGGHSR